MAALPERKFAIVRALVETSPDGVLDKLQSALDGTSDDSALGSVRALVDEEAADRRLRNLVLRPILPLFAFGARTASVTRFPPPALGALWRALKVTQPSAIERARVRSSGAASSFDLVVTLDGLLADAVLGLSAREEAEFQALAKICDTVGPDGAQQLIKRLELGPMVRATLPKLAGWIDHAGDKTSAAARIAYKDAIAVAPDGASIFFEMLAGHLEHPWMILRVISAVMDKPTQRYLADSELSHFAEFILADVDQCLVEAGKLAPTDGPDAGRAAARQMRRAVLQTVEIQTCVDLSRDIGWGQQITRQQATVSGKVEARLREAEKALAEAFPRLEGKSSKTRHPPDLSAPPRPDPVTRATTLLTYNAELRDCAGPGGFSALRTRMTERMGEFLDHYVDDVLGLVHSDKPPNPETAMTCLEVAADLLRILQDDAAAKLVLKRAHAAIRLDSPA